MLRPGKDVKQPGTRRSSYSLDRFGTAKAARAADLDEDGQLEIAVSCESATGDKSGVFYLKQVDGKWEPHDIGSRGLKYDRIELLDLVVMAIDLLTCEERFHAVLWYENPRSSCVKRPALPALHP